MLRPQLSSPAARRRPCYRRERPASSAPRLGGGKGADDAQRPVTRVYIRFVTAPSVTKKANTLRALFPTVSESKHVHFSCTFPTSRVRKQTRSLFEHSLLDPGPTPGPNPPGPKRAVPRRRTQMPDPYGQIKSWSPPPPSQPAARWPSRNRENGELSTERFSLSCYLS